jgi:BlaI family transcriptional regulator, penicillinase repressor
MFVSSLTNNLVIMKELTKAEELVMQILWDLKKGFVNDIIEKIPEPKPAYNTVSTIIRILEKKGVVDHTAYGKTYEYFPLISKEDYTNGFIHGFLKSYFAGSYKNLVSFFSSNNNLSLKEMEEIINLLQSQVEDKKKEDR